MRNGVHYNPMDIDKAIQTYFELLYENPGNTVGGWLERLGEHLEKKGHPVSEVDFEDDPEGSWSLSVYIEEGPNRYNKPYVEVAFTLADALERQGETDGPYPGVDLLLEIFAVKDHHRELIRTYTAHGRPLAEWTTDPEKLIRRIDVMPFEEVIDFVESQIETLRKGSL